MIWQGTRALPPSRGGRKEGRNIPSFVIPECFYQESILFRIKAFGFPIKDLGNDRKGTSFLSVFIRNPEL